jgi:putative spermidine/putrescine transport system substrate-binding protein
MEVGRREFLGMATAVGMAAASLPFAAYAKESITVLEWAPPHVDASKLIASKWDKVDCVWELQNTGAAGLAKVKATWPNPMYDLVDSYSPLFYTMMSEGWLETVNPAEVPNLADIPSQFLTKDSKGNIKCIPRSTSAVFFAVTDRCPIEIKTIEDLLNPKLKGQILWGPPTANTNLQTVFLALARGGNERNMDPGWKFLEELAKSGNIGRVPISGTDVINSLTTGEASVVFISQYALPGLVKRGVKLKPLIKMDPSLKTGHFVTGWVVMSNSKTKKEALEFANFTISKESSELWGQMVGETPTNIKAKASGSLAEFVFTPQELDKYAYAPDWGYMASQVDGWMKRFEKDIQPKL